MMLPWCANQKPSGNPVSGKCVGVQAVGQENSGAQANCRPDQKKDGHDADIAAPIPLELGGSGRRRWRFRAHVDG